MHNHELQVSKSQLRLVKRPDNLYARIPPRFSASKTNPP